MAYADWLEEQDQPISAEIWRLTCQSDAVFKFGTRGQYTIDVVSSMKFFKSHVLYVTYDYRERFKLRSINILKSIVKKIVHVGERKRRSSPLAVFRDYERRCGFTNDQKNEIRIVLFDSLNWQVVNKQPSGVAEK